MLPVDRPTVAEVVTKLTALGDADHVAMFLQAEGVRGDRAEALSCPVARYVERETCWLVSASPFVVVPTRVARLERALDLVGIPPPPAIALDMRGPLADFMSRFDLGGYPELEA